MDTKSHFIFFAFPNTCDLELRFFKWDWLWHLSERSDNTNRFADLKWGFWLNKQRCFRKILIFEVWFCAVNRPWIMNLVQHSSYWIEKDLKCCQNNDDRFVKAWRVVSIGKNDQKRKLTAASFKHELPNGECVAWEWLIYSAEFVYCFVCRLFKGRKQKCIIHHRIF